MVDEMVALENGWMFKLKKDGNRRIQSPVVDQRISSGENN